MFVPDTQIASLLMALFSMCCWGSWSNSLKFSEGLIRFELFFLNFSVAIFVASIIGAFTAGMVSSDGKNGHETFLDDWSGRQLKHYACALVAGVIWNIANLLLCKGIVMLGLALAFPVCIGTALVLGTLLTYVIQPGNTKFPLLLLGTIIALSAVCLAAFVQSLKDRQLRGRGSSGAELPGTGLINSETAARDVEAEPSMTRKITVCIVGGVLMGCWNPLVTISEGTTDEPGLTPYGIELLFCFMGFVSTVLLVPVMLKWPVEGSKSTPISTVIGEYKDIPFKAHFWSIAGAIVWYLGTLANAVAGSSGILSSAESYAIGQCANMIAILWGALFFKEFAGTDFQVKGLLAVVCLLYVGAIVCIAASG